MEAAGDTWAVVESTSHGLAQQRVGGVAYDVAVLTNVTSEHLEFHGTLEAYREAKQTLFARLARSDENPEKGWGKHAIINADDPQCEVVAAIASAAGAGVLRYGRSRVGEPASRRTRTTARTSGRGHHGDACRHARGRAGAGLVGIARAAAGGPLQRRTTPSQPWAWRQPSGWTWMPRPPPWHGSRASQAACSASTRASRSASSSTTPTPPRPSRKVLDELAPADPAAGCIAVFGSAGERDVAKRAEMGRVAGERCRIVVVTDEDPRGEDRMAILEAIAAGAEAAGRQRGQDLLVVPDRAEAIAVALRLARPGDAVLLAGKGHEKTIEVAGGEIAWDEAAVARAALRARSG